ncbi:TonB-dependent receptor domain-containing protein [Propionivibrio soli]|uniref:TonB-dependent receptor domain-containing protein n=1 Tax=Propionivibrio soli TaxID=2976531 RepID=UPI0021E6E14F|nr:TonB-dependent receptor [Propionivibrio soli]
MNPRSSLAASALAVLAAFPAIAAETPDGAIVVTATRQAQRANELLSDVSVISREDIEKARPLETLGELLSREGGVEFSSLGGPGASSSIYIRGANAGHTLLLIDGMRVGSATLGTPNIAAIPLSQVERVEILKGSASSLYGSDAIGGVIQVFTRRGQGEPTVSAEVAAGSHNTREANAAVSGQANALHYSLRVGKATSDGFSAIGDSSNGQFNDDNDGYSSLNASANVSVDLAKGHELGVQVFHSQTRNEYDALYYDASFRPRTDYNFRSTSTVDSYAAYSKNRLTSNWTSFLRVGRSTDDSKDHSSPTERDDFRTHQDQVVWQNDVKIPFGSLLLAAESLRQTIDTSGTYAETERTINSLIAGWTGSFSNHRLQLNARNDRNSQFGNKTTGGAAYGYQIDERWRARAAASTGFKAPSFNDLYFPDDPLFGGGNPNLKPETSRNREVGINYDTASTSASVTAYRNIVSDLIQWSPDDPSDPSNFSWHPHNVGKAKLEGVTLTGRQAIGDVTLRASADFQNHRDETTGKQLILRARRHATLGFDHKLGKLTWGAELYASGARYNDTANTVRLGGYTTLALRADYQLDKDFTLFARAGNVFDREYELRKDYETDGRTVFVGVRYQPK